MSPDAGGFELMADGDQRCIGTADIWIHCRVTLFFFMSLALAASTLTTASKTGMDLAAQRGCT